MRAKLPFHARSWIASLAIVAPLVPACSRKSPHVDTQSPYVTAPEEYLRGVARTNLDTPVPTKAQLERKRRSRAIVKDLGLPYNEQLPVVEDESAITPRLADEIASRCVATVICAIKGESSDQKLVDQLLAKFAAEPLLSPKERAFAKDPNASKQDLTNFGWRYESVHVFLWALGYIPHLNPPNQIADAGKEVGIIRDEGPKKLATDAKLRPLAEILDQNDLYYRLHWAALELRLKGERSEQADEEIVTERHRALNWLVRYMNQAWDDVTTDT